MDSTEYEPGDRVLVHGEVVEYIEGVGVCVEVFSKTDQYHAWVRHDLVAPRGAIVLDLDGYDSIHGPEALHFLADKCDKGKGGNVFARIARDFADQIEAQTKPPRIPEPTVPLSEVEASTSHRGRRRFVLGFQYDQRWVDGVASYAWDSLVDPVLIREGVES